MRRYAQNTSVSVERSREEIEKILGRYGSDAFSYATETGRAQISFRCNKKLVRFVLTLPDKEDFRRTASRGHRRDDDATYKHWEQACRQMWRALCLVIKAKLEATEAGIATFEEEFLAYLVLPNGRTVGETALPAIEHAVTSGTMPKSLLGLPEPVEQQPRLIEVERVVSD